MRWGRDTLARPGNDICTAMETTCLRRRGQRTSMESRFDTAVSQAAREPHSGAAAVKGQRPRWQHSAGDRAMRFAVRRFAR